MTHVDPTPVAATDIHTLVREHHGAVYGYAYRLCGSAADAEDISQQTFLIAHGKANQLRDAAKALAWLLAIVRTCYLKSGRRRRPMAASAAAVEMNDVPRADAVASEIDEQRLHQAIGELPEEFSTPLCMFYFEDRSYREIAEQLELPMGTVMSRLARAKQSLRRMLAGTDVCGQASRSPAMEELER